MKGHQFLPWEGEPMLQGEDTGTVGLKTIARISISRFLFLDFTDHLWEVMKVGGRWHVL